MMTEKIVEEGIEKKLLWKNVIKKNDTKKWGNALKKHFIKGNFVYVYLHNYSNIFAIYFFINAFRSDNPRVLYLPLFNPYSPIIFYYMRNYTLKIRQPIFACIIFNKNPFCKSPFVKINTHSVERVTVIGRVFFFLFNLVALPLSAGYCYSAW